MSNLLINSVKHELIVAKIRIKKVIQSYYKERVMWWFINHREDIPRQFDSLVDHYDPVKKANPLNSGYRGVIRCPHCTLSYFAVLQQKCFSCGYSPHSTKDKRADPVDTRLPHTNSKGELI